jgi:hypothetical protein
MLSAVNHTSAYSSYLLQMSKTFSHSGRCFSVLQLEDDVSIITGKLGRIASANGNSIGTATTLVPTVTGTTASANATGIVAQAGVSDFFSFTAAAGTATITGQVREQRQHNALPLVAWGSKPAVAFDV